MQEDHKLYEDLKQGARFHMPTDYPNGMALYWRREVSGVLRDAVKAFLERNTPMKPEQFELMREYIAHWLNCPGWIYSGNDENLELNIMLAEATDRDGLWRVLHEMLKIGIDPL